KSLLPLPTSAQKTATHPAGRFGIMVGETVARFKSHHPGVPAMLGLLLALALPSQSTQPANDWEKAEATHLKNIRQVTRDFVRGGEGYFSPDGKTIIFQAEEKDSGNPFYQIFTLDLESGKFRRVSPGVGKTTCSYFRPDGKKIIFASSHLDPDAKK